MTNLATLVASVLLLESPGPPPTVVSMQLRRTAAALIFELEFHNVSAEKIDLPLQVDVALIPIPDGAGRAARSVLLSSVDPATGAFGGSYAESVTHLRLHRGQARAVRVDLRRLKWSLGPRWTWTPRELWRMAEPGPYELSAAIRAYQPTIWSQTTRLRVETLEE